MLNLWACTFGGNGKDAASDMKRALLVRDRHLSVTVSIKDSKPVTSNPN
jgi:hypothetical protein